MNWFGVVGLSGFLAVSLGAFAAHGLKGKVSPADLNIFETGSSYHMYHTLALFGVALWLKHLSAAPMQQSGLSDQAGAALQSMQVTTGTLQVAAWLFVAGMLLFSGSLYVLVLSGVRWLGAITPIGGLALLGGWVCVFVQAMRS